MQTNFKGKNVDESLKDGPASEDGPIVERKETDGRSWTVTRYTKDTHKARQSHLRRSAYVPGFTDRGGSRSCPKCGFSAFGFSTQCSKCGEPL
jgi:hypothetical protein